MRVVFRGEDEKGKALLIEGLTKDKEYIALGVKMQNTDENRVYLENDVGEFVSVSTKWLKVSSGYIPAQWSMCVREAKVFYLLPKLWLEDKQFWEHGPQDVKQWQDLYLQGKKIVYDYEPSSEGYEVCEFN